MIPSLESYTMHLLLVRLLMSLLLLLVSGFDGGVAEVDVAMLMVA